MNNTTVPSFLDFYQLHYLSTRTPLYYNPQPTFLPWLTDRTLLLTAPVIGYWLLSGFFHILDISGWKWLDKYRIHESSEIKARNLASRYEVIRDVLFQQFVQSLLALVFLVDTPGGDAVDHLSHMLHLAPRMAAVTRYVLGQDLGSRLLASRGAEGLYTLYWWAIPSAKVFLGLFIIDSWQYFMHRAMHMNTFLYKKIHAHHHRLYVPYAYGAVYNHPIEGLLMDTLGGLVAERVAHLNMREATLVFLMATLKGVDVHCGYNFPWDPFLLFGANSADHHDIHHQAIGIKSNFAQPMFIHWDVILGTRLTREDIDRRRKEQKARLNKAA
ncbi:sphingosine hydroxylase [Trametes cingulata]|nr:sphingosine hydroxylase [Trametes cingulata]